MSIRFQIIRRDTSGGIGRHAESLILGLRDQGLTCDVRSFSSSNLNAFVASSLRNFGLKFLVDYWFVFVTTLESFWSGHRTISASPVCSFKTNVIHFSSCHLGVLRECDEVWKLLLPNNLLCVILEFLQYKFGRNTKVFLSEMELEQFRQSYGYTLYEENIRVIRPVLHQSMLSITESNSISAVECDVYPRLNAIFVGYNFRLKGLDLAIEYLERLAENSSIIVSLTVYGTDRKWLTPQSSIPDWVIFKGSVDYSKIPWTEHNLLLLFSKSESYGFVVQEALYNGVMPLIGPRVGAKEHLLEWGLDYCVVRKLDVEALPEWQDLQLRLDNFQRNFYFDHDVIFSRYIEDIRNILL